MNYRIVSHPNILHGKPRIRGTRIAVSMVLELIEAGIPFSEIRRKYYPQLTDEDIKSCIQYARQLIDIYPQLTDEDIKSCIQYARQLIDIKICVSLFYSSQHSRNSDYCRP